MSVILNFQLKKKKYFLIFYLSTFFGKLLVLFLKISCKWL